VIEDNLVEQLAQAVHEQYLAEQIRDGVAMGGRPAMMSWAELDEDKREANRAQVRDIETKLNKIGCTVGPRPDDAVDFAFTDEELDLLARHEHVRWLAQRTAAGWAYGEVRDDAAKRRPDLVSWVELPESEKDKDRDAVRNIPAVLATAGLRVIRV